MSSAIVSRWSRAFVAVGAAWFVLANVGVVTDAGRRPVVTLALYGFVFHTMFGKAYSLVPTYFDRELAMARAPTVQLPLTAMGTFALAVGPLVDSPFTTTAGAVLWTAGICVFVGSVAWTLRDNPTGAETGTGDAKAHRRGVDRLANAMVPVGLTYLLTGSYGVLAGATPLPFPVTGAAVTHLLAAGGAVVVLVAVGFRLLPRFTVVSPPGPLVWIVLPAAATGPALLTLGVDRRIPLAVGAAVEGIAVVGFAATAWWLVLRSDRDRIGFYGVLASGLAGVLGVSLGGLFAVGGLDAGLVDYHLRTNLLGFLGLAIVGVAYQFYPPSVGRFPGAGDGTALASILGVAGGLGLEGVGRLLGVEAVVTGAKWVALVGATTYAVLLLGLFIDRYRR